jgi:hypothetical protein
MNKKEIFKNSIYEKYPNEWNLTKEVWHFYLKNY